MPYTSLPQRHSRAPGRRPVRTEDDYFTDSRRMDSLDLRTSHLSRAGVVDPDSQRRGSDDSEATLQGSGSEDIARLNRPSRMGDHSALRRPDDVHHEPQGLPRRRAGYRRDTDAEPAAWRGDNAGQASYSGDKQGFSQFADDEDEDDEDAGHHRPYFENIISRFLGDSHRGPMRRADSTDSTGEPWSTIREVASDGPDNKPSLSRFSTCRTNSGDSNRSGDSDAEPELPDLHDPKTTGAHQLKHPANFVGTAEETEMMANMSYIERRKYMSRIRIEWNVSPIYWREQFLVRLAESLMSFGAPSHRIEAQLTSAARVLEIEAEFVHIPGLIMCSFGNKMKRASDLRFIKCAGSLDLGSLHAVHDLYRQVVHDEVSAQQATDRLERLLTSKPAYRRTSRIIMAFFLSAMICPLAFGGSMIDMWIAGVTGVFLSVMQVQVAARSAMYAAVYEITVSMIVSFASRGLSAIRSSHFFCYTAISSSGIVGILPGYLILSSSLELASKNIVCGSVRMVYALIYTLFLGFALQIGSDLFLVCDKNARAQLIALQERLSTVAIVTGTFVTDNATNIAFDLNQGHPISGTFTFTNYTSNPTETIDGGCYRNVYFPWWLQPFPWWTQFILVPLFSILSSMANLQPFWTREMLVMVVISSAAYAANKAANHFIFNRSDIVSAIGAFVVGLLGNLYSRKLNGTAFTSMVTGVLFLVPSGLSAAGGITAQGSGIDIGAAMISVTIGITVGLFMSQALVYMFGSRKTAAVFSF